MVKANKISATLHKQLTLPLNTDLLCQQSYRLLVFHWSVNQFIIDRLRGRSATTLGERMSVVSFMLGHFFVISVQMLYYKCLLELLGVYCVYLPTCVRARACVYYKGRLNVVQCRLRDLYLIRKPNFLIFRNSML